MPLDSITLTRTALAGLLAQFKPNPFDDKPTPPVPWGPVIRRAIAGPGDPIPWKPTPGSQVGINPQPLPPRWALVSAIADAVRVYLENGIIFVGGAVGRDAEPRALEHAGGLLAKFVDEYCGTFVRWLPKPPRPFGTDAATLGADLVVLGFGLERNAAAVSHSGLRTLLLETSDRVLALGTERLNSKVKAKTARR